MWTGTPRKPVGRRTAGLVYVPGPGKPLPLLELEPKGGLANNPELSSQRNPFSFGKYKKQGSGSRRPWRPRYRPKSESTGTQDALGSFPCLITPNQTNYLPACLPF